VFNIGHGWKYLGMGTIQVCNDFLWNRFSRVIFIYFSQDLINGYVTSMFIIYCQHGEVWQFCYYHYVEFECAFYVQNEMLCT